MTDALEKTAATTIRREGEIPVELGWWYRVRHKPRDKDAGDDGKTWLGCVTHIGSNYVKLRGPSIGRHTSYYTARVHFDQFDDKCERVLDADAVIDGRIKHFQAEVRKLMAEVQAVTAKLAITPKGQLQDGAGGGTAAETQALSVGLGNKSYKTYKKDLVRAREKTLPKLFEKIEDANGSLAGWMKAKILPLEAQAGRLRGVMDDIKDRVFSVELYAGLVEEVVCIREGSPAVADEPIRLMQRRHYMDEESLVDYQAGGIEFRNIKAFDKWLAKRRNCDRILPHRRCVVAFQVRREQKHRDAQSLYDFIAIGHEIEADKSTFLYFRNGDALYRLSTAIDFGSKLFPDLDQAQLGGKLWAKMFAGSVDEIITDGHYQDLIRKHEEYEAETKRMPKKERWHRRSSFEYDQYEAFDKSSVHYDDIKEEIERQIKDHNRLVLVLQGLLDRAPVFHPHPPWQLWTADGFTTALRLVYDDSRALAPAELPDFEAYRKACNKTLKPGSITVGQEDFWELKEGEKENRRRDRSRWRESMSHYRPARHTPYGDPGPGLIGRVARMRGRQCIFEWYRQRSYASERRNRWIGSTGPIKTTVTVPAAKLLNVDAYQPGDFKQFYDDPRTRMQYLQWAPLLLAAEDYHAGKRQVQEPGFGMEEGD